MIVPLNLVPRAERRLLGIADLDHLVRLDRARDAQSVRRRYRRRCRLRPAALRPTGS